MATLQSEITRLEGRLVTTANNLKTVRDNRIPGYAGKLSAEMTNAGEPGLSSMTEIIKMFAQSGATLAEAKKTLASSPAAVDAYVKGIDMRMYQLSRKPETARTPGEKQEYINLQTARDNFNQARYDSRTAGER